MSFHITWQPRTSTHKHLLYWETLPVDQLRNQTKHGSHKTGLPSQNSKETNWGGVQQYQQWRKTTHINTGQHGTRTKWERKWQSLLPRETKHQTSHPKTAPQEKQEAYHYAYLSQKRQMGTTTEKESLEREPAASRKTALVGRKGGWARKHSSMTKFRDLQQATHSPLQLSNTTWCNRSCNTDWVFLIWNAWDQICF